MNSYDIDGVIYLGETYKGLLPRSEDFIITGRSLIDEKDVTINQLQRLGIDVTNRIWMAPWKMEFKTRERSGLHKAVTINSLMSSGNNIEIHFEDDPIQANIIESFCDVKVVRIIHNLTEK